MIRVLTKMAKPFKPVLSATIFRPGRNVRILAGPSKGLRYEIFPAYGLAPLAGGWEPEAQRIASEMIRPGDVVYDVGGNYGIHTILFARLAGPTGRVIAFEPLPHLAEALQGNVDLNGLSNVECLREAVGEHSGQSTFVIGHHEGAGHLSTGADANADSESRVRVVATSLDDLVFERGYPPPNFIKMDIEGGEGAALRGAERVLATSRPVLLIDLHTPQQDLEVGQVLMTHGYRARRTDSTEWIEHVDRPYPDPAGLHGQVLAVPT